MEEIALYLKDNEWPFEFVSHDRQIVRAIVFNEDKNLYFVRVNRDDEFGKGIFIETAGGGVEEGENLEEAIKRELLEELGAEVEIIEKLGFVDDYYNLIHRHNINHYFLCKLKTLTKPKRTLQEIEDFHLSSWKLDIKSALKEYERASTSKLGKLLSNREVPVLNMAFEILNSQQ